MQSTGHTSTQAVSLTPTQGSVIMCVMITISFCLLCGCLLSAATPAFTFARISSWSFLLSFLVVLERLFRLCTIECGLRRRLVSEPASRSESPQIRLRGGGAVWRYHTRNRARSQAKKEGEGLPLDPLNGVGETDAFGRRVGAAAGPTDADVDGRDAVGLAELVHWPAPGRRGMHDRRCSGHELRLGPRVERVVQCPCVLSISDEAGSI